jgi:hypothetical protein
MNLIPLFDPKAKEECERRAQLRRSGPHPQRVMLFPEGDQGPNHEGNWLPQDACGGHQWNARMGHWQR